MQGNTTLHIFIFICVLTNIVMLDDWLTLDFLASLVGQLQNFKVSEMDIKKLYILIRT